MSHSNIFTNDLAQTSLNDAYQFTTFSQFIQKQSAVQFSPICIFCSSPNSIALSNDGGSFRQCNACKKQFKASFMKIKLNEGFPCKISYATQSKT